MEPNFHLELGKSPGLGYSMRRNHEVRLNNLKLLQWTMRIFATLLRIKHHQKAFQIRMITENILWYDILNF